MVKQIALASCSGMSPNGLVARVVVSDLAIDDICLYGFCFS